MKRICKTIVGVILVIIIATSTNIALATTQSDLNNQKQQNINKKNELEEKKEQVKEIKNEALKEVEELNSQITTYQGQISYLNSQIDNANTKIQEAEQQLKENQEEYAKQEETFKQRLVAVYESGETSYLDFLLSSSNLADFISNYYLVSEIAEMDTEMLEKLQQRKQNIENAKQEIEISKNELVTAKANKESVANTLKGIKAEKDAKVSQLSQEEQSIQKQIAEIQQANVSIDQRIRAMQAQIEAARQAAQNQGSNSGTSAAGFIKPVNSYVTTGMYYSSGAYHGAVDFGASGVNGMPVYAVADGIVVTAEALTTSYGNYILLYHPHCNLYTLYAHGRAGSIRVSVGQHVSQGQTIMNVGSTGNSTGPHLHFEVRTAPGYYNNRVNPASYLP